MDWTGLSSHAMDIIKKYRYIVLIVLAGIFLMALPEGTKETKEVSPESAETADAEPQSLQDSLAEILSQIEGAGKVKVLLTVREGEQTLYQSNEDISTGTDTSNIHRETVITSGSDRTETGLIQQVNPPKYLGAIVLCQGAESATVRLSIVEAVANVTGLTTDKITVLKMK